MLLLWYVIVIVCYCYDMLLLWYVIVMVYYCYGIVMMNGKYCYIA